MPCKWASFHVLLVIWFSVLWFAFSYLLIFIGRFATILPLYVFFVAKLYTSQELDCIYSLLYISSAQHNAWHTKEFYKWTQFELGLRPKIHFWVPNIQALIYTSLWLFLKLAECYLVHWEFRSRNSGQWHSIDIHWLLYPWKSWNNEK